MTKIQHYLQGFKHIIWDWNGTLVNDIDYAVATINQVLVEYALPSISREQYRDVFGFPVREYYERIGFDFSKLSFEVVGTRFIEIYNAQAKDLNLFDGVVSTLGHLRNHGVQHAILSAGRQEHIDEMISHFGISELFHSVYGIDHHYADSKIGRGQELMHTWQVDPAQTLLVGDTDHDLDVGEALGIEVLLVADGHQSFARLSQKHHRVLETRF